MEKSVRIGRWATSARSRRPWKLRLCHEGLQHAGAIPHTEQMLAHLIRAACVIERFYRGGGA
jgi:hypothetical protein